MSQAFFWTFVKKNSRRKNLKTQGKNSKLKLNPKKVGAFLTNFPIFFCEKLIFCEKKMKKPIKTQIKKSKLKEKTQSKNSKSLHF